jgi:NADPH:quinone reductase-like Zn-dependent oxidoreductase
MRRGEGARRRSCDQLQDEDFVAEVKAITGGGASTVVLDMVGGDYVPRNLAMPRR